MNINELKEYPGEVKPLDIEVNYKVIYGNKHFVPANKNAKILVMLLGKQVFMERHLKFLKECGWNIVVKHENFF